MSEVQRITFTIEQLGAVPDGITDCKFAFEHAGEYVRSEDYDAAQSELAALREELFQCKAEYDRAALKSAAPYVEIPACDEDGERALYEAFYIERAKTLPLPLGNSPLRYAGGQYINDFALFGWMVWLSRAQSRAGSSGQ